jgi:hypothetical protein
MNFDFLKQIAGMYTGYNEHRKAARCHSLHEQLQNGEASAEAVAEMQQFLHSELSRNDSEASYWLDCIDELTQAILAEQASKNQALRLLEIVNYFRSKGQHSERRRVQTFYRDLRNGAIDPRTMQAFDEWITPLLPFTDQAQQWRKAIEQSSVPKAIGLIRNEVMVKHHQNRRTTAYLSDRPGEVRLYAWAKRHWTDAPANVQQFINSYLQIGWDVVGLKTFGQHTYEFELTQCRVMLNCEENRAWHHAKQITINAKTMQVFIRNGQSSYSAQAAEVEEQAAAPAKPKRQRRKKAAETV